MKFLSNILAKAGLIVDGTVTLNSVANASTDTDRFIVIDNGVVKYRTGSQLRSDIDAASAAAGLPVGGAAGQILAKIDGTNYNTEWIDNYTTDVRQTVKAGEAINKGQAVYISSADGTNVIVSKASNTSDATSSKTLGLLAQNLSNNGQGFVITEGKLTGIDTSTAQAGDPVWLGTNGNLLFGVANKPSAPAHLVYLGVVTRANQNNGEIFVHVVNGFEIEELHDVQIQSYIDKGVLYRDVATNLWKHATIASVLGYTPLNPSRQITINGTTQDLSADRTFSVGTVTSITGGTGLTGGTITGSGTLAFDTTWGDARYQLLSNNPITGIGTTNYVPKFTGASTLGNSLIFDNGTSVGINTTNPSATTRLDVFGAAQIQGRLNLTSDVYFPNNNTDGIVITGANVVYPKIIVGSENTVSGNTNLVFGKGNTSTGLGFTFGNSNTANSNTSMIFGVGNQANTSGQYTILVGGSNTTSHAVNTFTGTFAIGYNNVLAHQASSIIGSNQTTTANNQLIFASSQSNVNSAGYNDIYFGTGPRSKNTNLLGSNITINGSGAGAGADLSGGSVTIAGGKGTGAGTPGDVIISTASTTTSGTTLQSLTTRFRVAATTGNVTVSTLAGTGTRMVVADSSGVLGTQTINVGSVTSVGLTAPTGFAVSNSPITSSGDIALSFASGYSLPTTASQSNWDTAYNNRITSLTTSGTSGAATLSNNTLNIPQYQAQGNYITSLTGEATASGPGAASVTLSTTAVTSKLLTGLNLSGGGTIAATDSILQAFGKVQNQISAMVGGVMYQGTWNASTNTPTLTSSVGVKGYYYIVDVSGTTNLNGITDWRVGDWAIFNGSTWDKVDNTDAVSSVNGFTGAVSLTTSHIAEGTNLYYLDSRSRTAISLTTTGNSGAATYDNVSGIINVPQYTLSGLGGVPTTRQLTINGTAFDLSADRSWSVGTVTSVGLNSTTSGITITNTPVTSSGALTINIATASGSQNGLLSSTDWNNFNTGLGELIVSVAFTPTDLQLTKANSQVIGATVPLANGSQVGFLSTTDYNTFNNKIGGSGASGQVAYFNGTSTITGESNLFWDAANDRLGIGVAAPTVALDVVGAGRFTGDLTVVNSSSPSIFINNQSANGRNYRLVSKDDGLFVVQRTGIADLLFLNDSGNLGLGVTPSAWFSGITALQFGTAGVLWSNSDRANLASNVYIDSSTNARYINNGFALRYAQESGEHRWSSAVSGTAGNAISFTQAMTLDASGRLGIGATSMNYALQVNDVSGGNLFRFSSGSTILDYYVSAGNPSIGMASNNNLGFRTNDITRMLITSGGNVGIGSTTPNLLTWNRAVTINTATGNSALELSIGDAAQAYFAADASDIFLAAFANKNLKLRTNNADRMTITSGGNVGIGTATPAKALDVYSSATTNTAQIVASDAGSTNRLYMGTFSNGGYITFGGTYQSGWSANGSNAIADINFSATSGASSIQFSTSTSNGVGPNERMRITSGGNVGIGTNNPTSPLHVSFNTTSPIASFINTNTSGTGNGVLIDVNSQLGTDNYILNAISNGQSRLYVREDGNVGIGTTTPATRLDVNGSIRAVDLLISNDRLYLNGNRPISDWISDSLTAGYSSTNSYGWVNSANNLVFGTNGTERMRITSGGNVGIGESNPASYKLQVKGPDGQGIQYEDTNGVRTLLGSFSSEAIVGTLTNNAVGFWTNNSKKMTITSGGAVEMTGTIKTGAPTGGTARAWKLGDAFVSTPGSATHEIEVEINGTTYLVPARELIV